MVDEFSWAELVVNGGQGVDMIFHSKPAGEPGARGRRSLSGGDMMDGTEESPDVSVML